LALNIYHEAQGEGRKGMLAVGWVVLNRTADPGFPPRVEEVVAQGCQFGWVCDDRPDEPADGRAWRKALGIARELLAAERRPADPTRGAMWFHHAEREDPGWGGRVAPTALIGNHLFYAKAARLPRPTAKPRGALVVARR
jgi:spore germination cell wall hydrolase CwlJ-like protein